MPRYRVTLDILVDVTLSAPSKERAGEVALQEINDRGNRDLTDTTGEVKFRFMEDSVKVVVCEEQP